MKLQEALFLAESADLVRQDKLAEAMPVLAAEIKRLRGALQLIVDETMIPDAWPESWESWSDDQRMLASAQLIAGGAITDEPIGSAPQESDAQG